MSFFLILIEGNKKMSGLHQSEIKLSPLRYDFRQFRIDLFLGCKTVFLDDHI